MDADMDVAFVLSRINLGQYCQYYWGNKSSTGCTYEQLSSSWPDSNPPLPSKEDMETFWDANKHLAIEIEPII